jgi:aryl-alcohol dehydrogenase-like predicted oxidoreductase
MDFREKRILGRSGREVGRLGVSSGYGAPAAAFAEAFEQGCNYFYWGSRRTPAMAEVIRDLTRRGQRDRLVVVVQVYNRIAGMMAGSVERALKKGGLDYADVLLLGWYNSRPGPRILAAAERLKERGLVKFLAMSGHHRPAFPVVAAQNLFDVFHVRYNAAHRGAETEVFPRLPAANRPGIVTYTATRWGNLLKPGKMPAGEKTPRASDCYRFVLSNPAVDVCMTGPKNHAEMKEALLTLERGPLSAEEMAWMRRVGDHVHGKGWF